MSAIATAIARARTALGWATADRREEAKGKLDELAADDDRPDAPASEEQLIDEAELHVRADHGDLAPHAEPDDRRPKVPHEGG